MTLSPHKPTVGQIKAATAAHFGVTVADLEGQDRSKRCAWPRHVAMYLCVFTVWKSRKETGRLFGGRDHSTVCQALEMVPERAECWAAVKAIRATLELSQAPSLQLVGAELAACKSVADGLRGLLPADYTGRTYHDIYGSARRAA